VQAPADKPVRAPKGAPLDKRMLIWAELAVPVQAEISGPARMCNQTAAVREQEPIWAEHEVMLMRALGWTRTCAAGPITMVVPELIAVKTERTGAKNASVAAMIERPVRIVSTIARIDAKIALMIAATGSKAG